MRFYLDLKAQVRADASGSFTEWSKDLTRLIVDSHQDWALVEGPDLSTLINEMAGQLPKGDLRRFLKTVGFGFRSNYLESGLTCSMVPYKLTDDVWSVRIRIRIFTAPAREAQLPTVGLEVTNLLLAKFQRHVQMGAMLIWKDRDRVPVLIGGVKPARTWRQLLFVDLLAPTLISLVSGVLFAGLLLGILIFPDLHVLHDNAEDWFKRLAGPLFSSFIASSVGIIAIARKPRTARAFWRIDATAPDEDDFPYASRLANTPPGRYRPFARHRAAAARPKTAASVAAS